jgi:hypothetical protein
LRVAAGDQDEPKREIVSRLVVLERNKLFVGASYALMAAAAFMMIGAVGAPGLGGVGLYVLIAAAVMRAGALRNLRAKKRSAEVRVTPEGVFVDGQLAVAKKDVHSGIYQPRVGAVVGARGYGSSVRLSNKKGHVVFEAEVEDEDEALAVLRVLGLDPEHKRAEFSASSPLFATLPRQLGLLLATFTLSGIFGAIAAAFHVQGMPTMIFLPILLYVAAAWRSKVTVGVDGILTRWLWWRRFIPMSKLTGAWAEDDHTIRLGLEGGESHALYTAPRRRGGAGNPFTIQHRDAVLARIKEAREAFAAHGAGADVSALVARGTRPLTEWIESLKRLSKREGGYRDAVVREEDLWRLVEDPAAPEDARAGAALLLRQNLDEPGKARVRVAAEATVSPKLRVAFDAAAAESDAALEEALGELAPASEEPKAAAQRRG